MITSESNAERKYNQHWYFRIPDLGSVRKSYIVYLKSQDTTYIFVGQLHLMPIDFKLNPNMTLESIAHLGSCLF